MKDEPLDIPGPKEIYGKNAFVCPYRDGWELQANGGEISEDGMIIVDEFGKTNIRGIYCAEDAASRVHQAISAASTGGFVAAVINNELNTDLGEKK